MHAQMTLCSSTVRHQLNICICLHYANSSTSRTFLDSGHGGQTKDRDGDEVDGFDEVIYPLDFKTNGHIVDDVRYSLRLWGAADAMRI